MNLRENIILALEGLRANKMRALLTMLGIIIGIASVIAITSLGDAMSNSVASSMESLGGKNIQAFLMPKDVEAPYMASDDDMITDDMISRFKTRYEEEVAGVSLSTSVGAAKTVATVPPHDLSITGVNGDYFGVQDVKIAQGRMLTDRDVEGEKNVIVISDILSRNLFGAQADPIGKELQVETPNGTEAYYIVGVYLDPKTDASQGSAMMSFDMGGIDRSEAFIPITTAKKIMDDTSTGYSNIMIKAGDGVDSSAFAKTAADYFNKMLPENSASRLETQSMETIVSQMKSVMSTMSLAIAVIAGISLLVGGIGVMNIMLVSVTERTREIGIRKALGARNSAIRIQFIVESIIICFIGGIIGIALGAGFGALGGLLIKYPVVPSISSVIIAVVFSMAIGIFFGYYPANKAAKLDPIDALRYE